MNCAICGGLTKAVIELPGLPGGNQTFLQCQLCGHGMLETQYEQTCGYLSGSTEHSRRGIDWFRRFVSGEYECALDFGCNDGHLLHGIKAKRRIGIDPQVFFIAPSYLALERHSSLDTVDAEPDLIVCRHTLEHLPNPIKTLRELVAKAVLNAQIVIEVPCLDSLAESFRFDQIYNDHLQYFTMESFHKMLRAAGLEIQGQIFVRHESPFSMVALCVKGNGKAEYFPIPKISERYTAFRRYAQSVGSILSLSSRRVAYGASFIFPVLLYHIGLAPEKFESVLDDDKSKWGTEFHGLTVRDLYDVSDAAVLVTVPDSFNAIYRKLDGHAISAVPMI